MIAIMIMPIVILYIHGYGYAYGCAYGCHDAHPGNYAYD